MSHGAFPVPALAPGGRRLRLERLLRSDVCAFLFLVILPLPIYALELHHAVAGIEHGSDFVSFWRAGGGILHGHSPYPAVASLPTVARPSDFDPFVYPAPAAYLMAPFALLPFAVAATIFLFASWLAVAAALLLLDVRDWRCHAATFASVPVVAGTALGTFSPWLLLGAAAAWRYRDHVWRAGPIVAALVVAKIFVWPLWFWLVFTRRYTAALVALVLGIGATALAWIALGFEGLRDYPRLLSRLTHLVGVKSYSPFALLHAFGLPVFDAQRIVSLLAAAFLVAGAFRLRSRRHDVSAFVAMLAVALFATPVLWPHYFALAVVPLALVQRRFSWAWALPLALWVRGDGWSDGRPTLIVPVLLIASVPFVLALTRVDARSERRHIGDLRPMADGDAAC